MMGATVLATSAFIGAGNAWMFYTQAAETTTDGGASSNPFDFITPFLNVGLVGVLLLMFVLRKGIVPEWVLKQAEDRHARELEAKEADITELKNLVAEGTKLYNDQVVPAFTRSIDVNREYVELLRQQANQAQSPAPRPAPRRRPAGG